MATKIKRSTFLKGICGFVLAAGSFRILFDWLHKVDSIPCRILGPSMDTGHLIRDGKLGLKEHDHTILKVPVLIVGGGVSGLSTAWWLEKQGFKDFTLLELESEVGGNSVSCKNGISAYPWGAHYIPIANSESEYVRELFEELGIIESIDSSGLAKYNELALCHDPEERLFKDGSFQEGLVPKRGLRKDEQAEVERFFKIIVDYRNKIGKDGKPAFSIPLALSSQDKELLELDSISMETWLADNGFKCKPLLWYVNYCCRDDYGATVDSVSAWAGIHYFAGRRGRATNAEQNAVVTWPEGNGYVIGKLKEKLSRFITNNACVYHIEQDNDAVRTYYRDKKTDQYILVESKVVVFAAPRFVGRYVIEGGMKEFDFSLKAMTYPPWMVANISLREIPASQGISSAWDNVGYLSDSLGYVVATHQNISTRLSQPTVVTYYYPLSKLEPVRARTELAKASPDQWRAIIIEDLNRMHPQIENSIISIDLWPWGHGMISPGVGYIWGEERKRLLDPFGKILFAHSDMSGISNFEESQYRGVEAAKSVIKALVKEATPG